MLDHMTIRVRDLARTKSFYTQVLAPLGYAVGYEATHEGAAMVGFVHNGKFDTWFVSNVEPVSGPTHICWRAPNHAAVDAFYAAAIAAGGKDNGKPGLRPHYHANYYGAFVLDPDGNNVEAVCHDPA
jgi:catechol 2,3-dioxygenase-like lactoylglutathione lyase family enzyme